MLQYFEGTRKRKMAFGLQTFCLLKREMLVEFKIVF